MGYKQWSFLPVDKELAGDLLAECGFDPLLCLLMTGRGIKSAEEAVEFLTGNELQSDPFLFADMDVAVERVQRAVDQGEKILIYGDYDVDGITSTVLLYSYLRDKGAFVSYRLPLREGEGYGLHCDGIEEMAAQGVNLIITVDNGISAVEEIALANERGMDVVVVDHHQPQEKLPPAVAVVDPHRHDCPSEFKDYAGVGMAFYLVCALEGDAEWALREYGDLVALGTLADVMPLRQDNRIFVRCGLQNINAQKRMGLHALRRQIGVDGVNQTSTAVTFTLVPRLNAAGRMGNPATAASLLLCDKEEVAECLAGEICELNAKRQEAETAILTPLLSQLSADPVRTAQRVLVVWGEGWHHGVLGILASRLQERYGRPCVVLSVENGIARGSGRSLKGFSLFKALQACDSCLLGYGGHELAAGVTLEASRLEEFCSAINQYAAETMPEMPTAQVRMDCRLKPSQIKAELLNVLSALEPFGAGNPQPLFGLYRMTLERIDPVGGGKHLRLTFVRDGVRVTAMQFSTTLDKFPFTVGDILNLSVSLDRNEFRGAVSVSVVIRDIRYAALDQEEMLHTLRIHDAVVRRDFEQNGTVQPNRDAAASVYRTLKANSFCGTLETLVHQLSKPPYTGIDVLISLDMLREAGLIDWYDYGNTVSAAVRPVEGKSNLFSTATARYLQKSEG